MEMDLDQSIAHMLSLCDKLQKSYPLFSKGNYEFSRGNYEKAASYYTQSIKLQEQIVQEVPEEQGRIDQQEPVPVEDVPEYDQELLDKCWADAMLATTPAPWEIQKAQPEEHDDPCQHEYSFKSAVGTVCDFCGLVKLHIHDTFEFKRPYKKRRDLVKKKHDNGNAKKFKLIPEAQVPEEEEEEEDYVRLTPQNEGLMYPHQKEGFKFLCSNLLGKNPGGVILAHAPGAGKTFVVVSFIQSYFGEFPGKSALFVVPKIVHKQWIDEFKTWKADEEVPIYSCLAEDKDVNSRHVTVTRWFNEGGVMIISHQLLAYIMHRKDDKYLEAEQNISRMLKNGPDVLVVDEAHCARNDVTKVFSALKKIGTVRKIFLSGTVFQNNFEELFNFLELCRPEFLNCPEYVDFVRRQQGNLPDPSALQLKFFKQEFNNKIMDKNKNGKCSMQDRISSILLLRRLTSRFVSWNSGDFLKRTLQGLDDFVLLLNMSEEHQIEFKRVKDNLDYPDSLTNDCALTKAAIHPYLSTPKAGKSTTKPDPVVGVKTNFVMRLVRYCHAHNEKVIIFSQYLDPLHLLKDMINSNFGGGMSAILEGKASSNERQRVIDEFQNNSSDLKVLLASITACGEGITLVAASRVVILDTSWNPSRVQQAVARAYRPRQKRRVFVYRLLADGTGEADKHGSSMVKFVLCKQLLDPEANVEEILSLVDSGGNGLCKPLTGSSSDEFLNQFMIENLPLCTGVYALAT